MSAGPQIPATRDGRLAHAEAEIGAGVQAHLGGDIATAAEHLRTAIDLLDHPGADADEIALRARALVSQSLTRFALDGLDAALAMLDTAVATADSVGANGIRVLAQMQRGGLYARSGLWRQAIDTLAVLTDQNSGAGARERAVALNNLGLARQFLGEFAASERDLTRSVAVATEAGETTYVALAGHNLGCLAALRGDLPGAIRLMAEAQQVAGGEPGPARLIDQARAHLDAGLTTRAAELFRDALAVAERGGHRQLQADALLGSAQLALVVGDGAAAARHAAAAAEHYRALDLPRWGVRADLLAVAAALAGGDPGHRLEGLVRGIRDHRSDSPHLQAEIAVTLAEVALHQGDAERAAACLAQAPAGRSLVVREHLQRDRVEAELARLRGDAARRSRVLRGAAQRLAVASARQGGLEGRAAHAVHAVRLTADDVGAAIATGSGAAVLRATERWRAVSTRLGPLTPDPDPELATRLTELRHLREQLDAAPPPATDLQAQVVRIERAITAREHQLAGRVERRRAPSPLAPAAIRAALAERGASALSFCAAGGRLGAVTVEARGIRWHPLADERAMAAPAGRLRADLRALGQAPTEALRAVVMRAVEADLAELGALIAPALPGGDGPVVVVPSRLTPSVPWRAVPGLVGRPLVVASSLTQALRDPTEVDRPRVGVLCGPALARAEHEAAGVGGAWPGGRVDARARATASDLVAALRGCDLVHIAAHGHHHEESPLFSSVRLHDGPVFGHELATARVRAGHVVLSSCEVGRAVLRPGEEALGLTAALLAVGVRSVVAAVAPVRDDHAETIMTGYHRHLAAGDGAALALERASAGVPDGLLFAVYGGDWRAV